MQFQLPGLPLFPAATDGLLLKPTLRWQIQSDKADRFTAELAYITGGLDWEATYNVVTPNTSDVTGDEQADVLGWVTIHNQSGTEFPQARIKLMAGDVAKIQPGMAAADTRMTMAASASRWTSMRVQVTQKPFDDFHLYDLNRTVSSARWRNQAGPVSRGGRTSPSSATTSTTAPSSSFSRRPTTTET